MINSGAAEEAATALRNALSTARRRVPVYRSAAPSSMESGPSRPYRTRANGRPGRKMLDMRGGGYPHAVAPPHQHTVLGPAQIRNAHGEPQSDGGERDRKSEGRNIRQHAAAKIVRFIPVPLIA